MSDLHLVIGNKNYSSWSFRPWVWLRHSGILFDETVISLYSIADAMYAPVVLRFNSYGVSLSGEAAVYSATVLQQEAIKEWMMAADAEQEIIEQAET